MVDSWKPSFGREEWATDSAGPTTKFVSRVRRVLESQQLHSNQLLSRAWPETRPEQASGRMKEDGQDASDDRWKLILFVLGPLAPA